MNRNLLGLLVLSAFLPIFSAEAFLLPPFKLDAKIGRASCRERG